jgi:hypothetical protein
MGLFYEPVPTGAGKTVKEALREALTKDPNTVASVEEEAEERAAEVAPAGYAKFNPGRFFGAVVLWDSSSAPRSRRRRSISTSPATPCGRRPRSCSASSSASSAARSRAQPRRRPSLESVRFDRPSGTMSPLRSLWRRFRRWRADRRELYAERWIATQPYDRSADKNLTPPRPEDGPPPTIAA